MMLRSYIFGFNGILRPIFFATVMILSISFLFIKYLDFKAESGWFVEHLADSKIRHFKSRNQEHFDVIVVGDSTVLYHFDSNKINESGIRFYNFGVSGQFLLEYKSLVEEALEGADGILALSIPVDVLLKGDEVFEGDFLNFSIRDYFFVFNHLGFRQKIDFFGIALKNSIILHKYRFNIAGKVSETVGWFHNKIKGVFESFITIEGVARTRNEIPEAQLKKLDGPVGDTDECGEFFRSRFARLCVNGDGILYGSKLASDNRRASMDSNENSFSRVAISVLKGLIKVVRDSGVCPVLIVQSGRLGVQLPSERLEMLLGLNVMVLNFDTTTSSMWFDNQHLNSEGRNRFSELFVSELLELEFTRHCTF